MGLRFGSSPGGVGPIQAVTGKTVNNNNVGASVTIPAGQSYYAFTGTNVTTLTINYPAGSPSINGLEITVYFSAAVSVALTLASTGATFVDAPATVAAKTRVSYIYDSASTQWLPN
jgi:hypothetical protein